jgi:hypothetical protein
VCDPLFVCSAIWRRRCSAVAAPLHLLPFLSRCTQSQREEEGEALPQMNDGQLTTHPEPDSTPFRVHLMTRAGRVMRARTFPRGVLSPRRIASRGGQASFPGSPKLGLMAVSYGLVL